jgi:hypothetical protein
MGLATPINRVVQWGLQDASSQLVWLGHTPDRGVGSVHYLGPAHP